MKSAVIAAAAFTAGCAAASLVGEDSLPKQSLELEETIAEDSSQARLRLGRGGSDSFRILHTETEGNVETLVGARVPVDSPFYKGSIVVCTQSTPGNDNAGVNFDGTVPALWGMIVGGAVERDAQSAEARHLAAGYVGMGHQNGFVWKLCAADAGGDSEYAAVAGKMSGRDFAGAGLTVDRKGNARMTVASGRFYDGNRGNGFGYRAWASTDFGEGHAVDAVFSTKTTFSRASMIAPIDVQDGRHDPAIMPNVMDVAPGNPTRTEERAGAGGVAVRLSYNRTEAGESGLVGVRYNFPGEVYLMLGLDIESNNPESGEAVRSAAPMFGVRWKHFRLDYSCRAQDGEKPVHTGMVAVNIDI